MVLHLPSVDVFVNFPADPICAASLSLFGRCGSTGGPSTSGISGSASCCGPVVGSCRSGDSSSSLGVKGFVPLVVVYRPYAVTGMKELDLNTANVYHKNTALYEIFFNTLVVVIVSAWWPRGSRSSGLVRVVLRIWRTIDGGVGPCQSSSIKPSSTLQVWLSTKTWEKKLILFIRNFILYLYLPWKFYTVSS